MINHANRYADACRAAATIQGLDPLTAAANARAVELAEAGVSYDVEQTGGFTMVACFYLPYSRCDECGTPMDGAGDEGCEGCGGRREGGDVITCTHEGDWLVCQQARETWVDGPQPGDFEDLSPGAGSDATAGDVVALVLKRATA
jgi:hypothetical protein